jgi:hypothetical protein
MKEEIIADLGNNYRASDSTILDKILVRVTKDALSISNRKTSDGIESEIIEAVKSLYLLRGTEDVESLSESGKSAKYRDAMKKLREDIISNGKRRIF